MTARRAMFIAGLLAFGLPAAAQDPPRGEGYDFDTLAACSVIYGRIGEIYGEKDDSEKSASFRSTSLAYSASAFHMLSYIYSDQEKAYNYSTDRMDAVAEKLNENADTNPDGETGVIEDWLGYCDTLGNGVDRILAIRAKNGDW